MCVCVYAEDILIQHPAELGGLRAQARRVTLTFSLFALFCHVIILFQEFALCLQMRQLYPKIDYVFCFVFLTHYLNEDSWDFLGDINTQLLLGAAVHINHKSLLMAIQYTNKQTFLHKTLKCIFVSASKTQTVELWSHSALGDVITL